jgi:hypothetical protein
MQNTLNTYKLNKKANASFKLVLALLQQNKITVLLMLHRN